VPDLVVVLHRESSSGDRIDHIEVRSEGRGNFSVWARKYGKDPITGRRRMLYGERTNCRKSPEAVRNAIGDHAGNLSVEIDWADTIRQIASIDWVTAAVIADKAGYQIPELPTVDILYDQGSPHTRGEVEIGAEWGYDLHSLSMSFEQWVSILGGESWEDDEPYWYEGEEFTGTWSFEGKGELEVTYDGGGVGWTGGLGGLDVINGPKVDDVDLALLALSSID
jgi:hypothetical protein